MGQYTNTMQAYRKGLAKEMHFAAWTELPLWAEMMGFVGTDSRYPKSLNLGDNGKRRRLKPTGKPIEVLVDFEFEGSVGIDIPVKYPLTAPGVYGDKQLLGTEEPMKIAYMETQVNQVRKGVLVRDGKMSEQVLKKPEIQKELMTTAQQELKEWNQKWNAFQPYNALLTRYSANLTAAVADGGKALTPASHPNFYCMGVGKATWSDTAATYETNVSTALSSLVAGNSIYEFSPRTIELAALLAVRHKIQPVDFGGGKKYWIMVIDTMQADQLRRNTNWKAAQIAATTALGENSRIFTGSLEGLYAGVMVFVDQNAPGARISSDSGYVAARGTVNYGNANPIANPIDEADKKLAILFGQSAVTCGYASQLSFESETWDYKNKKTEGSNMIVGFQRADIYDTDGFFSTAGNFYENSSSLVIATYSPYSITWTA